MALRGGLGLRPHTLGDPHHLDEVDLGVAEEEGKINSFYIKNFNSERRKVCTFLLHFWSQHSTKHPKRYFFSPANISFCQNENGFSSVE